MSKRGCLNYKREIMRLLYTLSNVLGYMVCQELEYVTDVMRLSPASGWPIH
jgi:hypothetical protein